MDELIRIEAPNKVSCDWCKKTPVWKKRIKGGDYGAWSGGIYMRACEKHKSTLEQMKHRKKMGK